MDKTFYLICTTPRSGSNLLCDLLKQSGVMGNPQEFLNPSSVMLPFSKRHNLIDVESRVELATYLKRIVDKHSSPNQVFGMKLLFDQLQPLIKSPDLRNFLQQGKFIWLIRQDFVAQAVSLYIAWKTDEWTSMDEEKNRELAGKNPREIVEYDEAEIKRYLDKLTAQNLKWLEFFTINNLEYLQVNYEDILSKPNRICRQVCNFCGIDTDYKFSLDKVTFKKQGDELNQKFTEKFRNNSFMNLQKEGKWNPVELKNIKIV